MEKKGWVSPELLVIVRSRPEEAVLTGCKGASGGTRGADFFDSQCYERSGNHCNKNKECNSIVSS